MGGQMIGFAGAIEISNLSSPSSKTPGDYAGYGAFGLPGGKGIDDPAKREKSLLAEINNGRLAMVAIIGMWFQNGLTGSAWGDWALYTDSPLRADLTNELGACPPLGFWDPLALSKGKTDDPEFELIQFRRRRAVEIQHGRVSMLATIGYIVPEYFKWPGYLSPSMDLKFEDVPTGLAAFSKLPVQGGAQIVAFAGFVETTGFFSGESKNIGLQRCATQGGEP